jgi:hypothetical protein
MGADDPVGQDNENSAPNKPDSSVLLWLVKDGPKWARIPAICIGLLVAASPALILVNNWATTYRKATAEDATAAQLQMGVTTQLGAGQAELAKRLKNAPTEADREKIISTFGEELNHQIAHLSNPADAAVKWTIFEKKAARDYWAYKVFPSDGCVLVARVRLGVLSEPGQTRDFYGSQWLKDPSKYSPLQPGAQATPRVGAVRPIPEYSAVPRLVPAVYHAPEAQYRAELPEPLASLNLHEAQGGCLNPHPWPFQETWGAYINQCQQPIYRRWNDGCTHVQLFDHCANVWGPVVWQFCSANHHP